MMKLLGLFFFVAAAVIIGLVIAYWYLRRVEDERRRLRRQARVVPMPEKHRPVDLTPDGRSVGALVDQTETAALARDSDVDDAESRKKIAPVHSATAEAALTEAKSDETAPLPKLDPGAERDDLKRISGIGPKLEQLLNANGIFHFRQIAEWQDADIDAIADQLGAFRGRIRRDDWVGQARKLST